MLHCIAHLLSSKEAQHAFEAGFVHDRLSACRCEVPSERLLKLLKARPAHVSSVACAPVNFAEWRRTAAAKQAVHDMWLRVDAAAATKVWPPPGRPLRHQQ